MSEPLPTNSVLAVSQRLLVSAGFFVFVLGVLVSPLFYSAALLLHGVALSLRATSPRARLAWASLVVVFALISLGYTLNKRAASQSSAGSATYSQPAFVPVARLA